MKCLREKSWGLPWHPWHTHEQLPNPGICVKYYYAWHAKGMTYFEMHARGWGTKGSLELLYIKLYWLVPGSCCRVPYITWYFLPVFHLPPLGMINDKIVKMVIDGGGWHRPRICFCLVTRVISLYIFTCYVRCTPKVSHRPGGWVRHAALKWYHRKIRWCWCTRHALNSYT